MEIELSIIIKTLNEERNIGRCIEAILGSITDISTEVIVADSGSTDRTVEIAATYPVTVVQLANPHERSCGIGPQLGFQHSRGRYVLILDADMVLHASFASVAIARMSTDDSCAGIGGKLIEKSGVGYEYDLRKSQESDEEHEVAWLDGGGLYRRAAIDEVGYLSNRNLHAYEEKELGLRLTHAGWHLYRVPVVAVDHYGYSIDSVSLLFRRWKSGYADACGESIRACVGKPYLFSMVKVHRALIACLLFQTLLLLSLIVLPWSVAPFMFFFTAIFLAILVQAVRKKSFGKALYSILHLNIFAIGLVRGIWRRPCDPHQSVESIVIRSSENYEI